MKVCKECGGEFEPGNTKAIFCSPKCKQKDYRKSVAEKIKELQEFKKVQLVNLNKNTGEASNKPLGGDKTDYEIDSAKKEESGLNEIELAFLKAKAKFLKK